MKERHPWWFGIRMWLHMKTHRHMNLAKPGVGAIQFCTLRGPWGAVSAAIKFTDLPSILVDDIQEDGAMAMIMAKSSLELRRIAVQLGGRGVTE